MKMKTLGVLGILMLAHSANVWAADIPQGFGKYLLGGSASTNGNVPNIHAFDIKWDMTIMKGDDGKIDCLRLAAYEANGVYIDSGDEKTQKALDDLKAVLQKQFGEPKSKKGDGMYETHTWQKNGRMLEVTVEEEDGASYPLVVYLRTMKKTAAGSEQDGFATFFASLKNALTNNDQESLYSLFHVPFKDGFNDVYSPATSLSFKDKSEFFKKAAFFFQTKTKKAIFDEKPRFDKRDSSYHVGFPYSSLQVKKVNSIWKIIAIPYQA